MNTLHLIPGMNRLNGRALRNHPKDEPDVPMIVGYARFSPQVTDMNGVATEVRQSNPNDLLLLSRTGYYRLYVFVSLYNITVVPPALEWSRQIGQNNNCESEEDVHGECAEMTTSVLSDGNSFFEFYVKPAASSAGNSEIGTRRRAQRRRSRSLFSWYLPTLQASSCPSPPFRM